MGLFDTIINSYKPLGDEFLGVTLQTKSLDNEMANYWISPAGELFREIIGDAVEMVVNPEIDYNRLSFPFKWVPTGKHKKLSPVYYTGKLIVYPGVSDNGIWPTAELLFKHGKIIFYNCTYYDTSGTRKT